MKQTSIFLVAFALVALWGGVGAVPIWCCGSKPVQDDIKMKPRPTVTPVTKPPSLRSKMSTMMSSSLSGLGLTISDKTPSVSGTRKRPASAPLPDSPTYSPPKSTSSLGVTMTPPVSRTNSRSSSPALPDSPTFRRSGLWATNKPTQSTSSPSRLTGNNPGKSTQSPSKNQPMRYDLWGLQAPPNVHPYSQSQRTSSTSSAELHPPSSKGAPGRSHSSFLDMHQSFWDSSDSLAGHDQGSGDSKKSRTK